MEGLSGISKKLIDPLKLVGMINYSLITSSATTGKKFINPAETNSNSYIAFYKTKIYLGFMPRFCNKGSSSNFLYRLYFFRYLIAS